MLNIYKTIDGKICEIEQIEDGCWINLINPSEIEINMVTQSVGASTDFIKAALDDEETSRIDTEDNQSLIILDIPLVQNDSGSVIYSTIPLGIVVTKECIITICLKENPVIREFSFGAVRSVFTHMKTRFILQILFKVATKYLWCLKQIDRLSGDIEKRLHKSMKNKELIQLLDLEKSLVFFSTSLKANENTMEKIQRGRFIKLYEDDQELLEDVIIENKQAIEMSNIYSSILSGTMDAFASVISNNLNIVMKFLTSITIVISVPTMIASFYGMNVPLPFQNSPHAIWFVLTFTVMITSLVTYLLIKRKMF